MFESLKEFNNIVVTGPQRSGTRIAAKIISKDTEKEYIDERELNFHDFRLLQWYLMQGNVVIQCPGLCHLIHRIENEDTLIIIMYRDINDIINSEGRNWSTYSGNLELYKYGYCDGIISRIKYDYWTKVQAKVLGDRGRKIYYSSLSEHPLFITKPGREKFRWNQTK